MMFSEKITVATLAIVALLSTTFPNPIANVGAPALSARVDSIPVPTVQEIISNHFVDPVPKDTSLFYTGLGGGKTPAQYSKEKSLKMLKDVWKDRNYPDQFTDPQQNGEFFDRASAAFAQASSGKVTVLLPAGTGLNGGNPKAVWTRCEWPNLRRSGVSVYRVDVTTTGEGSKKKATFGEEKLIDPNEKYDVDGTCF